MKRAAILGQPVGHSLSPVLHRAAYAALGLSGWTYQAIECQESELAGLLRHSGSLTAGYSCTMPLKRAAVQLASTVTATAAAIGAANTLLPDGDDGWTADNTDWIGIRDALADRGVATVGRVAVLGAGGTAQAALAALTGASAVDVLVRNPERTAELRATAERLGVAVTVGELTADNLSTADLVISTVPAGAADHLADHPWRADQALLDVVYHPWPTVLATAARAAGTTIVSGASMLLFQAARQVELMTGSAAPVAAMRAALRAAAPDCGV